MGFNEVTLIETVKKQVRFKLFSSPSIWLSLVGIQLFGIVLSSAIHNPSSMTTDGITLTRISMYDSTFLMVMSYIWIVTSSIGLGVSSMRRIDFTFVSTRLSQFISSVVALVVLAAVGAVTAYLGSGLVSLIINLFHSGLLVQVNFSLMEHLVNVTGTFGYLLMFAAAGYLAVCLYQLNRFVLPGMLVLYGGVMYLSSEFEVKSPSLQVIRFFEEEMSIMLFLLKVIAVTAILLFGVWLVTRNQEVSS